MRILRLDLETGEELDLHPYVTVLGGLDAGAQHRVAEHIARIARGDVDGIGGLVEAYDMLIDINQERISSLGLPADADVIVNAEQLPGAVLMPAEHGESQHQRALADSIASVEVELSRINTAIAGISEQLARDTASLDDARRSLDEFAVTAHESALRSAQEAEQLVRRRLESTGVAAPAYDSPPPLSDQDRAREHLADTLAAHRHRSADLEVLLDEERIGLLQLLEQLESERAVLEQLRAEMADQEVPFTPAEEPEPEPAALLPDPADVAAVDAAIRRVAAGAPAAPLVPSLPAAALADQIAAHHQRQREFDEELADRGMDRTVIQDRIAKARRVADEAAEAARPKTVSPEDDREIERLHDIANDNVDRRTSRRGGKEATRAYEEANEALEKILDKYGFPTYASFIMGRTAPSIDEEARRQHEVARQHLADLERELDEVSAAIDQDPHGRMLRAEREQLWAAARELLGNLPDDVEGALRNHKVPGAATFDAPDELRELLRRLRVDTSSAGTTGRLLEIADQWYTSAQQAIEDAQRQSTSDVDPLGDVRLPGGYTRSNDSGSLSADPTPADRFAQQESVIRDIEARRARLAAQIGEREAECERLAAQIAAIEAEMVALDDHKASARAAIEAERDAAAAALPDPEVVLAQQIDADPTVRTAREQAALTGARLERHHIAVEQVDRLHSTIGEIRKGERALVAQRDSLHTELASLRAEVDRLADSGSPLPPIKWQLTDDGVGPIEWYLLGRVASLRSVSVAGSVPLVLNDAFRGLPASEVGVLCAALARIGENVQVIYLGDERGVIEWAETQGLDLAAVVRPGQPAL